MTAKGLINRIRRQVGIPTGPPNIAADELQFDPVAGIFYYMPDDGGAPLVSQRRALEGIIAGSWSEESSLSWTPGPMNTAKGVLTIGRIATGEYYLTSDTEVLGASFKTSNPWQKRKIVGFDGFNNGGFVLEFPQQGWSGVPANSVSFKVINLVTGVKQELDGSVHIFIPY